MWNIVHVTLRSIPENKNDFAMWVGFHNLVLKRNESSFECEQSIISYRYEVKSGII